MMAGVIVGTGDGDWLQARWRRRMAALGRGVEAVGDELIDRYADRARDYHDLRHLRQVLETVDELIVAPDTHLQGRHEDLYVIELAAWFHDAVYDVRRTDNEAASAALARDLLAPYLDAERLDEVARVVLLTRDHAVAVGDRNGAVVCDADLVVLAGSVEEYDAYARRVRAEYAHVSDEDFRLGRAAVLHALTDLPALFHTEHGAAHWEAPARANLQRELAALNGS